MYTMNVAEGNLDSAFARVAALPDGWDIRKTEVTPAALFEAFLYQHKGDHALARKKV
ncbi:MAG: hypothetical protein IPG10_09485 [Flavobacteriales bacterium]|nr:hypothetical protein [Flavobacteriales bacterium]